MSDIFNFKMYFIELKLFDVLLYSMDKGVKRTFKLRSGYKNEKDVRECTRRKKSKWRKIPFRRVDICMKIYDESLNHTMINSSGTALSMYYN